MLQPKKETLAQKNARIRKEIEAREKRISDKEKKDQKNSHHNSRRNKAIGAYKIGGLVKIKKKK